MLCSSQGQLVLILVVPTSEMEIGLAFVVFLRLSRNVAEDDPGPPGPPSI